jgi:hypothetical protein
MPFMFEKLEVYQKAVDFADEVAALTEGFPRGYGFLVDQLNRAALSIATNLAEGKRTLHKARSPQLLYDRPRLGSRVCSASGNRPPARARQRPHGSRSQGAARSHRQNDQRLDQWPRQARRLIPPRIRLTPSGLSPADSVW